MHTEFCMANLETETVGFVDLEGRWKKVKKIFISCILQFIFSVFPNVNEYLWHLQSVHKPISLAGELGMMSI